MDRPQMPSAVTFSNFDHAAILLAPRICGEFLLAVVVQTLMRVFCLFFFWRQKRMPGKGRRAVVYNSPAYHLTGVAMFSCVLMSLGFDVTAVIKVRAAQPDELETQS